MFIRKLLRHPWYLAAGLLIAASLIAGIHFNQQRVKAIRQLQYFQTQLEATENERLRLQQQAQELQSGNEQLNTQLQDKINVEAQLKGQIDELKASKAKKAPANAVYAAGTSVWDQLVQCEATGNWAINNGNGFYGGLQFTPSTWLGYGGGPFDWDSGAPFPYSREQQIVVAEKVLAGQGWGAWPACATKLGLR